MENSDKIKEYSNKLFKTDNIDEVIKETKEIIHTKVCRNKGFDGKESMVYSCKTCGINKYSCICSECFIPEEHIGHEYYIDRTDGFTCDCGDETLWRNPCPKHGHKFEGDPLKLLPDKYKETFIKEIPNVLSDLYKSIERTYYEIDEEEIYQLLNKMI